MYSRITFPAGNNRAVHDRITKLNFVMHLNVDYLEFPVSKTLGGRGLLHILYCAN